MRCTTYVCVIAWSLLGPIGLYKFSHKDLYYVCLFLYKLVLFPPPVQSSTIRLAPCLYLTCTPNAPLRHMGRVPCKQPLTRSVSSLLIYKKVFTRVPIAHTSPISNDFWLLGGIYRRAGFSHLRASPTRILRNNRHFSCIVGTFRRTETCFFPANANENYQ